MTKTLSARAYDGSLCKSILDELRKFAIHATPGTFLPSENALMHKYGISRSTANKVLNLLEEEDLIERQRGRGSLVRGERLITYLLPCPDFLSFNRADSETCRLRYAGIMKAAAECNFKVETIAASRINDRNTINYNLLSHINAGSMVITDIWYKMLFQFLFESKASVVMTNKEFVPYGFRQYTRNWHSLELSDSNNMKRTLDCLHAMGCRQIGAAGLYLLNEPHLTFNAYSAWAQDHNMPEAVMDVTDCKGIPREELSAWCSCNKLDAVIWIGSYCNKFNTIQAMLGIPENVQVFGWNFVPECFPEIAPFPCCIAPYEKLGYDAVKLLAQRPRLSPVRRSYSYIFKNAPAEFMDNEKYPLFTDKTVL